MPNGELPVSRSELWNTAEAAERRKDATVAREWELALPSELSEIDRLQLAQKFAGEVVKRYGVAADIAIHAPNKKKRARFITFAATPKTKRRHSLTKAKR